MKLQLSLIAFVLCALPFMAFSQEKKSTLKDQPTVVKEDNLPTSYRELTGEELASLASKGTTITSTEATKGQLKLRWSDADFGEVTCSGGESRMLFNSPGAVGYGSICIACIKESQVTSTGACRELTGPLRKTGK